MVFDKTGSTDNASSRVHSGTHAKVPAPKQLVDGVRKLLAGEQFISPAQAKKRVANLRRGASGSRHDAMFDREL